MNRLISTYGEYAIWQLSVRSLYQLAEFVVCQNHEHHTKRIGDNFQSEVLAVYKEELQYYERSQTLIATTADDQIIGSIRLMNWDREQPLPMQTYFNLSSFEKALPISTNIWHIGRFAVSAKAGGQRTYTV